jgi:hypothetical protein
MSQNESQKRIKPGQENKGKSPSFSLFNFLFLQRGRNNHTDSISDAKNMLDQTKQTLID